MDRFLTGIIIGAVLVIFGLLDMGLASHSDPMIGTVISRVYTPATSSTNVGYVYSGNGATPVVTTSSSSESYKMIVNLGGMAVSADITPQGYAACPEGSRVAVSERRGKFTGLLYGHTVTSRQ